MTNTAYSRGGCVTIFAVKILAYEGRAHTLICVASNVLLAPVLCPGLNFNYILCELDHFVSGLRFFYSKPEKYQHGAAA